MYINNQDKKRISLIEANLFSKKIELMNYRFNNMLDEWNEKGSKNLVIFLSQVEELKDITKIDKVNCDTFSLLCKDIHNDKMQVTFKYGNWLDETPKFIIKKNNIEKTYEGLYTPSTRTFDIDLVGLKITNQNILQRFFNNSSAMIKLSNSLGCFSSININKPSLKYSSEKYLLPKEELLLETLLLTDLPISITDLYVIIRDITNIDNMEIETYFGKEMIDKLIVKNNKVNYYSITKSLSTDVNINYSIIQDNQNLTFSNLDDVDNNFMKAKDILREENIKIKKLVRSKKND